MMKLTINGIEAELKADTTFKLVRENPYFQKTPTIRSTLLCHCANAHRTALSLVY